MATRRTRRKTAAEEPAATEKAAPRDEMFWKKLLDGVQSGSNSGSIKFIKEGRTRLKLVPEDDAYFIEVTAKFRDKKRTKYLVLCWDVDADAPQRLQAVLVSRSVLASILTLAAEGYEIFDPDEGHGITIIREGAGLNTEYNVLPSPRPVPTPDSVLDQQASLSLMSAADEFEQLQETRAQAAAEGGDEEEKPARRGRRRSRQEAEDDEEDWD